MSADGVSVAVAVVAIYFAPAIVALSRGVRHMVPIAVLNVLAAWTVIGWVVALMWAVWPAPVAPRSGR